MIEQFAEPETDAAMAPLRRVNIRDDVYVVLRRGILNHSYPPGQRLDLDDLSSQLQVSRTPVKEALHRLEAEGLVQILPRRGTFVSALDAANISDSYDVRLALECFVAPTVTRNVSSDDVRLLHEMKAGMRALLDGENFLHAVERYIRLDQEFHTHIVKLGGNERLLEIYRTVGGPLQLARVLNKFDAADYLNYTEPEHAAILAAVEARDSVALQNAFTQHVQRAKDRVLARIDRKVMEKL